MFECLHFAQKNFSFAKFFSYTSSTSLFLIPMKWFFFLLLINARCLMLSKRTSANERISTWAHLIVLENGILSVVGCFLFLVASLFIFENISAILDLKWSNLFLEISNCDVFFLYTIQAIIYKCNIDCMSKWSIKCIYEVSSFAIWWMCDNLWLENLSCRSLPYVDCKFE